VSTNLRIGVAGLGAASKQILPHIDRVPGMALKAGADTRPDAVEEFANKYKNAKAFHSVEEMYASGEIDAVWIATPNVNHAEHTIKAAEKGIHIIVEKPTAVTLAEVDQMIDAADRYKVKLVQGHSKVYGPAIQKIREIVASGRLGKVIQINSWNSNDWLQRPRLASEVDTSVGGGLVFRQGPHMIDIVRYIGGGMVKSVRAITGRNDKNFNTEGDFAGFLEFENGCAATVAFNGYGFFDIAELTWGIGEGGKRLPEEDTGQHAPGQRLTGAVDMAYKYANPRTTEERATRERSSQSFFGITIVTCEHGVIRQSPNGLFVYSEQGKEEIACPKDEGRAAELKSLQAAIDENRAPFLDGRWGKATLEVCLAMLQSSRERRELTLLHQVPSVDVKVPAVEAKVKVEA
jgi:phthalate 4,5-cis-dihydrodiol dehydrogenase